MTLPVFVAGLILLLAGQTWFTGAATVGWILLIVGLVPLLFTLALLVLAFLGLRD